jgi:hypothetical protein
VTLTTSTFNVVQSTSYPAAPPKTWSVTMPEPISYEFRVVEYMKDGKIDKVALQMCKHTHDQYGNIKTQGIWQEVPRTQIQL